MARKREEEVGSELEGGETSKWQPEAGTDGESLTANPSKQHALLTTW